jgi:hypothetical protein
MTEKKHYQVLEEIVDKLNKKGRDLSVHDDHDKEEFVILRIKEGNKSIKVPFTNLRLYELEEGKTIYETPCKSALAETPYGYTNDKDIEKELKNLYDNNFEIYPLVFDSLREISKIQEELN